MDGEQFDTLMRLLALGLSRRSAITGLAALTGLAQIDGAARKKRKAVASTAVCSPVCGKQCLWWRRLWWLVRGLRCRPTLLLGTVPEHLGQPGHLRRFWFRSRGVRQPGERGCRAE
jgi:hypothetical protein